MADTFAVLLRRHRLHRQLTQEALAERAGISSRSVGEMERGRGRSPRPRTVEQLVTALELTGDEREEFIRAGRTLYWDNRPGRRSPNSPPSFAVPSTISPRQLPADLPDFVARDDEIAILRRALTPGGGGTKLAAISGPAGIGKTALAVHAGHQLAPEFPDGQLYAALRDATGHPVDPAEVLAQLLQVLGVDGSALPAGVDARAGLFRTRMAGRQVLLVLDDADGHCQVEPLIADGAAVMVTSRLPLTGLPGVTNIDLRPLPNPAAIDLLCRVAGTERVRAEPAAATELVTVCGGLPLAVRVVAARLAARPQWTIETINERLADERRRLDELRHGDLAVRPGLQLAYRGLTPAAARAFALLGALGVATFPGWPVAALLDVDSGVGTAILDELLDARLLDDLGPDQAGQRRYRFHEVTRLYARERQLEEIDEFEWQATLARAASGWLALARQAQDRLHCERFYLDDRSHPAAVTDQRAVTVATNQPIEWFEAERDAVVALVRACVEAGLVGVARALAGSSADFYELRGYYSDWRRSMQTALNGCRQAGDRRGEATMLRGLGSCLVELDDLEAALSTLQAARALAEEVNEPIGAAMARKEIGLVLALTGRLPEAETELRAAIKELERVGRRVTKAMALTSLGFVLRQRGDIDGAVRTIRAAIAIARSCRDPFVQAHGLRGLAGALLADGRGREAEDAARQAAALFVRIGDPIGSAQSLRALGESLAQQPSRMAEAKEALAAAAAMFRDRGNSWGLALTELSLGEVEVRRGDEGAVDRLQRSLRYWTDEGVPALRARALVALASAAERTGDPTARELLVQAHRLYQELGVPAAAELADQLGLAEAQLKVTSRN